MAPAVHTFPHLAFVAVERCSLGCSPGPHLAFDGHVSLASFTLEYFPAIFAFPDFGRFEATREVVLQTAL